MKSYYSKFAILAAMAATAALAGCAQDAGKGEGAATTSESRAARTEVERGPVRVSVEVIPAPARLSDEPILTLRIAYEKGVEVIKPPFGEAVGDFLIRDYDEPLPEVQGNQEVMRLIYTLEPRMSGRAQIDPITILFTDKRPKGDGKQHKIETEALAVEVLSTLDTASPKLSDVRPFDPPVPLRSTTSWWWIALIALAVLPAAGYFWWRHRGRLETVAAPTPREQADRELVALWRSGTAERDVKLFFVELTGIVRRYIERTTAIQAPEQTTEEFLREIGQNSVFSREERERLREFLESADLVKFARHQPVGGAIEESYRRARTFVGLDVAEVAA